MVIDYTQVEQFTSLGSRFEENGYSSKDIRERMELVIVAFMNRKDLILRVM